ncbi:MAG: thiamine phosphate synthase [Novosphingobium sp.]
MSYVIERLPPQLYLISPLETGGLFPDRLARALDAQSGEGCVSAFQFRVKGLDDHDAARLAEPLQRICFDREVAFIVNDSITLAKRLGADGVHLGQDDLAQEDNSIADARERLGKQAQIGVTCHASRDLAMAAGEAGADYVAFGAFFPTTTKLVEHYADTETLRWWQQYFLLPCVAIGGITPENCRPLVEAGADFIAVSGAVWNGDEAAAVRAFEAALVAA